MLVPLVIILRMAIVIALATMVIVIVGTHGDGQQKRSAQQQRSEVTVHLLSSGAGTSTPAAMGVWQPGCSILPHAGPAHTQVLGQVSPDAELVGMVAVGDSAADRRRRGNTLELARSVLGAGR